MTEPPDIDESLSGVARAMLDDAACGLMRTTGDGCFLYVNRTFCTWVGRAADDLVGRRRLADLFTMGGKIFHQTHWTPLLQMQGSISEVKLDVVHASGSTIPMVLNAVRREQGGTVVHDLAAYVARNRDTYERELVRSRKKLEELVAEAKDRVLFAEQMVGIVSHDLRNPLSSISMGMEVLKSTELDDVQTRVVDRVTRAAQRSSRLILDLLDFTQARLGRGLPVTRRTINLHPTIAAVVEELRHVYPGRTLQHASSGAGPCSANPDRLAQIVGNLVSNAMTYGRPDTAIRVTSTVDVASFSIEVHNQGEPIPDAVRAHLFEPMTRGTDVGASARSVGLGLYIVREIAKAHGGTVRAESAAERGTTFVASFPRG